ncbi:ATP-binding cassette subfamily C protein [Rhodoplanes tepidamans]|nr:ATP-binding cassette subfamily C protein [Rhodoplanes tepidamans]
MSTARPSTPPQPPAAAVFPVLAPAIAGTALISGVVNLLALTAPLFMLQVYDRVLSSRSVPTLVGLAVLAAGLYAVQGVLDVIRARVLLRLGDALDARLSGRVHAAIVGLPLVARVPGDGLQPLRDLDTVRGFVSGSGPAAFFDLPWMPLYLGLCFLFHVWLGVTALASAVLLVAVAVTADAFSRAPVAAALRRTTERNVMMEADRRGAEAMCAMGLGLLRAARWQAAAADCLAAHRRAGDVAALAGGIAKALRTMLQSAMLAVGAWLVIEQQTTAGVMIASSIVMGRALAPVDAAVASWKPFLTARQSWARLAGLLALMPPAGETLALPPPACELRAEALAVVPPGRRRPTVAGVGFAVPAGSALAVIGPSGSGKSTLVRALVGVWRPAAGAVRLDGASLDQWDRAALGRHVGYLPQDVALFDGTVAENIARFAADPDPAAVVAAAQAAGVHALILRFESGYATRIGEAGAALSAGQRQGIGLARALYGDPFLVVLDEPDASLDADGEAAVARAIAAVRARRGIAVVAAHRPAALAAVDLVLAMEAGRVTAFGPRDEVLARMSTARPATAEAAGRGVAPRGRMPAPLRILAEPAGRPGESREASDGPA